MECKQEVKPRLSERFIREMHRTTILTWVAFLTCVGCIIIIFAINVPEVAAVFLRILQVSFAFFSFNTGYRKETLFFYTVCLLSSAPLIVLSIYNIATYVVGIRAPFGYVIIGMNLTIFLAAQVVRQIGLIVRKKCLKDSSIRMSALITIIIICAALLPITFAFTVIVALGENFQSVPFP